MLTKMNLFWTDKLFSPFSDIIIDNTQPNNYKHHYIFPSDQTASFFLWEPCLDANDASAGRRQVEAGGNSEEGHLEDQTGRRGL